ncbi:aminodeoxychorismate lyase [Bacillus alkalicellulosilyticus]|uniref:aminodeoxychorismate lyase n=1 Tax=Alkalihalobacterium alkalicellulosilyticum TaxID=1912214 RepID=UPI0009962FA1|nr:aminodeoxychorismate lyase [Bacillus alkalicellulosilyticus]
MYLSLNGEVVEQKEATISVFEHGFMYGLGAFETFRIYKGHPFLLDDHFQRLRGSLLELGIEWNESKEYIVQHVNDLLQANELEDAYVRWNVSAGVGPLGLQTESYHSPTTIVYMKELPQEAPITKKVRILQTKRNTPEGQHRLKSHHYLNNILGKRELGNDIHMEGLFLTEKGHIAEGVVSNVFWVKDDVLYTPDIDTGILNGVTRQFVIELAKKENVFVKEGFFHENELKEADEVFITNSIQEIVPIISVDDTFFSDSSLATKLQALYSQYTTKLWSKKEL